MLRLSKMSLAILVCFGVSRSWAAEETYRFRTSEPVKAESGKVLKFSQTEDEIVPVDEGPIEVSAMNYPKHTLRFGVMGATTQLRNEITHNRVYTSTNESSSPGAYLGYQLDDALDSFMALNLEYFVVDVPSSYDRFGQNIIVEKSSAQLQSLQFYDSLYCHIGDTSFNRFCVGYVISYSAFVALDYPQSTSTKLHLATARDWTVGFFTNYTHELAGKFTWFTQLMANASFGANQNKGFAVKDSQNANWHLGVEWPLYSLFMNARIEVDATRANMLTVAYRDTIWRAEATTYAAGLGLRYEWGSSNKNR